MDVPVNIGGQELVLTTEESVIKRATERLPSQQEFNQWIGAVVVDAARQILTNKLPYKSAGEASKVARDFVAIAKDLNWDQEAKDMQKASPEDRDAMFRKFVKKAEDRQKSMLGLTDG